MAEPGSSVEEPVVTSPAMLTRRQVIQAAAAGALGTAAHAQTVDLDRLLTIPRAGRLRVVLDTDTYNEIDDQ